MCRDLSCQLRRFQRPWDEFGRPVSKQVNQQDKRFIPRRRNYSVDWFS